jgi:uncharacterized protein YaaQ
LVLAILCALATVQGHRGGDDGGNDGGDGWGQGIGGGRFRFRPTPWALNPHGIFNKRLVSVGFFPWMDLFSFRSQSLNRSHDEIDVDLVGGFVSFNHAPIAVLAFWKYMAEWSHENFTAEGSSSLMAQSFYELQERTSNGSIVHTYRLNNQAEDGLGWFNDDPHRFKWIPSFGSNGSLFWFDISTTIFDHLTNSSFEVNITWMISAELGQLTSGNVTFNPRMVESMFQVTNYEFVDDTNHLALKLVTVFDNSTFSATSDGFLRSGFHLDANDDDLDQVYVNISTTCVVMHNDTETVYANYTVDVSEWSGDATIRADISTSVAGQFFDFQYENDWDIRYIVINFPENASNVLYDPALGSGPSPAQVAAMFTSASAPALSTVTSLLVAAVSLAALLI